MLRRAAPLGFLLLLVAAFAAAEDENSVTERKAKLGATPTSLIADMARQLITQSYSNSQVYKCQSKILKCLTDIQSNVRSNKQFSPYVQGETNKVDRVKRTHTADRQ
jgi:hypothetical protein